jgi:ABC-2 type transport system ATP-binding protein
MNGLDPAGMSDMREMILSFVDEGRTVVLSSHLLDEVQRTCDSVAIVDRGTVIRQGPIAELLAGSSVVLEVECSEPERARGLIQRVSAGTSVDLVPFGLSATLPAGAGRDLVAEISRVLIEGGVDLYRIQPVQASLESWFLEVTSRLGAAQ